MIVLRNLFFDYQQSAILEDLSISFDTHKAHVIYGANGAGKTTLLMILQGIYRDYRGSIMIEEHDLRDHTAMALSKKVAICTATQPKNALYVHEVLSISLSEALAYQVRIDFDLDSFLYKDIQYLSEGERQWIFLARAFGSEAPYILLDEPTAFLDIPHRRKLHSLIYHYITIYNKTFIINTHDLELIQLFHAQTYLMHHHRLQSIDSESITSWDFENKEM